MDQLTRELVRNPQKLTNGELRQGPAAMQQLLEHYFAEQSSQVARPRRRGGEPEQDARRALDGINRMVAEPNSRSMRLILLGMFSTLLQAKGDVKLDPHARPLLLVEDPETRLHPIMLSVARGCSISCRCSSLPPPTPANWCRWCRWSTSAGWCASRGGSRPTVSGRAG